MRRGLGPGAEPGGRGRGVTGAGEEEFAVDLPKLFPPAARETGESGPRGPGVGVKKGSERSKSFPEPLAALATSTLRGRESGRPGPGRGKAGKRVGFQIRGWEVRGELGAQAPEDAAKGILVLLPAQPLGGLSLSGGSRLPGAAPFKGRERCLGASGGDSNPCPRRLRVGSGVPKAAPGPLDMEGATCGRGSHPRGVRKVLMSGPIWDWQGRGWEMRERLRER